MSEIEFDRKGFMCECGARNDYPDYVKDHWNVKLMYSCSCKRQYILHHGTATKRSRDTSEIVDSEAFGD